MKSALFVVLALFISLSAHAHEDHDHPDDALLVLEGRDAVGKFECGLFVMDMGFAGPEETPEQFFANVRTSYSHGDDAPEDIVLKVVPGRPGVLAGLGPNGKDQLAVFLPAGSLDLTQATAFNLKWWHETHFHTNRCAQLQVHQH